MHIDLLVSTDAYNLPSLWFIPDYWERTMPTTVLVFGSRRAMVVHEVARLVETASVNGGVC